MVSAVDNGAEYDNLRYVMRKLRKIFAKKEPQWEDEYAKFQALRKEIGHLEHKFDSVRERTKPGRAEFYDYSVGFFSDCYLPPRDYEQHIMRWRRCMERFENTLQNLAKNPKIYCHEYSWDQFLEYVDWPGDELSRASQVLTNADWYGATSFEEAMHMARHGWDGLDKIIPKAQRFPLPNVKSVADMSWQYDVAGGSVDVGRYLMGVPDCMRRISRNQNFMRPSNVKKLLFTFNMHGNFWPMQLVAAGYRAYEMVKIMEDANIHVEVVWHIRVRDSALVSMVAAYDLYVTVKQADEELDLSRIMFALAHPSFLRRLAFSEMERNPADIRKMFGFHNKKGYGYVGVLPREDFENNNDVIYMVAADLFGKNSDDVIRAQNEKIINAVAEQCGERRR